MNRFVILAAPRTGSNYLCSLLGSHPEIICHHELFNPRGVFTALESRGGELSATPLAERDRDPDAFLERVWRSAPAGSLIGFKMTRGQDPTVFHLVLDDTTVRKIILRRRSRLRTYLSERIAIELDQWEVYRPEDLALDRPRIHVDVNELLAHASENERFYAELDRALAASEQLAIRTDYEDLLSAKTWRRLLAEIGVRDIEFPLNAKSVRQNSGDLRQLIANYDDVVATLRGTPFEAEIRSDAVDAFN